VRDPLAGKRQAINEGEIDVLEWRDEGKGCPVEQGQVFELRACVIEITSVRRLKRGRSDWVWRATFRRTVRAHSDRPHLLKPRGGYVSDARSAMQSGEERPRWEVISGDLVPSGPPPEPEAVPPHEVRELPTSVAARARFEELKREEVQAERELPLPARLARLRQLAREKHVDISAEERVIERRIVAIERKLHGRRAA